MELHEWFIRLTIPLIVLFLYHSARAYYEIRHPEDLAEEIPMTVAEYEAKKASERDAVGITVATKEPLPAEEDDESPLAADDAPISQADGESSTLPVEEIRYEVHE